ncbi:hypothetical protein BDN72DRAFT_411216 [Pluteus cervinus]|uniref:Uncharacterized protein n=1 Tax=Pluteus cervinus TaxID=181527 RepID=A0ACD3AB13_9AGAR|nr:hypothetical protein BDN72DRAFT_411216 [Pluteus cervinus]
MGGLREYLGLVGPRHTTAWLEVQNFIQMALLEHLDLSRPISRKGQQDRIDLIIHLVWSKFPNAISSEDPHQLLALEAYIVTVGNKMKAGTCIPPGSIGGSTRTEFKRQEKPYSRPPAVITSVSKPSPDTRAHPIGMRAAPFPKDHVHPQVDYSDLNRSKAPLKLVTPERSPTEETEPAIHHRDDLHEFLASCNPPLTDLHPYLLAYGCTSMAYIANISQWSNRDIRRVVEKIKLMKCRDVPPVKPIDWDVFRHHVKKMKVAL